MNRTVSTEEFATSAGAMLDGLEAVGQPAATALPTDQRVASPFGCMKGTFAITGADDTLLSALDPGESLAWDISLDAKAARMMSAAIGDGP